MREVDAYYIEGWSTSVTTLFGVSPKVHIVCGRCRTGFSKRFRTERVAEGNPRAVCPTCDTINRVGIYVE